MSTVEQSISFTLWGSISKEMLDNYLMGVPKNALITFTHEPRDRPFDPEGLSVRATWKREQ